MENFQNGLESDQDLRQCSGHSYEVDEKMDDGCEDAGDHHSDLILSQAGWKFSDPEWREQNEKKDPEWSLDNLGTLLSDEKASALASYREKRKQIFRTWPRTVHMGCDKKIDRKGIFTLQWDKKAKNNKQTRMFVFVPSELWEFGYWNWNLSFVQRFFQSDNLWRHQAFVFMYNHSLHGRKHESLVPGMLTQSHESVSTEQAKKSIRTPVAYILIST